MNKIIKNKIISFLIFLGILFPVVSFAEPAVSQNIEDFPGKIGSLIIDYSPKYPGEFEDVNVTLKSYLDDLNAAEMTLVIDDEVIKTERGLKEFSFKTKANGEVSNIKIIVKTVDEKISEENILITPNNVDLIYEVQDNHRPFNYRGRSIAIMNSEVKLYAFPDFFTSDGKKILDSKLIYTWYKDRDILLDKSGYGKNTLLIKKNGKTTKDDDVYSVLVSDRGKTIFSKESIRIKSMRTDVQFYLLNPALNFSYRNIGNPNVESNFLDSEILAVPYFMNNLDGKDVKYTWKINDDLFDNKSKDKNKIILSNSSESFIKNIKLSFGIFNRPRFFQSFNKEIDVNFTSDKEKGVEKKNYFNKGSSELE